MYALKLELKLNNKERSLLKGCAGFRRVVYNYGLDMVAGTWQNNIQASETKILDQAKKLLTNQVMKSDEYGWMKIYPSTIYQSALQDLKDAFSRWSQGQNKFPVHTSKRKGDKFTVYKTAGVYPKKGKPALPFTNRQVLLPGRKIKLPGLGTFRLKEAIPFLSSSQTFAVSRQADKWFVSFTIDAERIPPIIHVQSAVGIDLGVKTFATLSDRTTYDSPKPLKKARIRRVTCPPGTAGNNARRLAKIPRAIVGNRWVTERGGLEPLKMLKSTLRSKLNSTLKLPTGERITSKRLQLK